MSRSVVATGIRTTTANNVVSSSFTPVAGTFLELYASVKVNSSVVFTAINESNVGWGFTWNIACQSSASAGLARIRGLIAWAFVPAGTYTAGTLAAVTSVVSANMQIAVVEDTDPPDAAATVIQDLPSVASAATPITGTFAFAVTATSRIVALACSSASATDLQPGDSGGMTQVLEQETGATSNLDMIVLTRTGTTNTTVDAKNLGTTNNVLIGLEFKVAPAAGSPPNGTPTLFTATPAGATKANLAWTAGSNNHTNVEVYQAPDVAGSPGTWSLVATLGVVTTYQRTGLTPGTKYHFGVYEVNNDGASPASNIDDATTANLPTISRVTPAGGTISMPIRGLGLPFVFEVDATAGSGTITSIVFTASVDGVLQTSTSETLTIADVDVTLPTDGAQTVTAVVTNSNGDTAQAGWNINITDPGEAIAPSREQNLVEIPVPYGSSPIFRSLRFRDPVTKSFVVPTFVLGDVTIRKDSGTRGNTLFLPQRVGSTFDFDFELDPTETQGGQIKIIIDDVSNPKVWLPERMEIYTYGDPSAFYTEDQIATNGAGVVDAGIVEVNHVPVGGDGAGTPWGPAAP